MPIIVAPMSQQRMAFDEGELAVARAVAKEGTAMVSKHSPFFVKALVPLVIAHKLASLPVSRR